MEQCGLRETSRYLAQERGLGIHLLLMQILQGKNSNVSHSYHR